MKKSRLTILSIASILSLVACSGSKDGSSTADTSKEPEVSSQTTESTSSTVETGPFVKEPTEITVWTTYNDSYQAILNNAIEELKKSEPNITVNNIKQSGSYDDLKKMVVDGFAVDNYPDIVAAYPDSVADFIQNNKALDMDGFMRNENYGWTETDFDDIPEAYIKMGSNYTIPGTYSLPASKSTECMYYNQDVLVGLNLREQNVNINNGQPLNDNYFQNLTWEELFGHLIPALDAYDKAQDADHKIIDRTTYPDWAWVGYDSDDNLFITLAEQYGYGYTAIDDVTGKGKILFETDEGMKALMKRFAGYVDNHYFTTKGIIKTNVNYRSTVDAMLFSIGSTGGVKYQFSSDNPHNIGCAPIPHAEGKDLKVISQGPDLAFLSHNSDNRALATWLFYKTFTSKTFNGAWALATGYSPIRNSVMESGDYQDYASIEDKQEKSLDRLYALNAQYAVSVGDALFTSPVFKGSSTARTEVSSILAAVVASNRSDTAINEIFATAAANTRLKM